jgi:hypothetical protein
MLGQAISEGIASKHHSRNSNFPVNVHGVLSLLHLNRNFNKKAFGRAQ